MDSFETLSETQKSFIRSIAYHHREIIAQLDSLYHISESSEEKPLMSFDEEETDEISEINTTMWIGNLQGIIYKLEHIEELNGDLVAAQAVNVDVFERHDKKLPKEVHSFLEFADIINMKNTIDEKLDNKKHEKISVVRNKI